MVSLLKQCIIMLTQQNSKQKWFQEERVMWITKHSTASEHDIHRAIRKLDINWSDTHYWNWYLGYNKPLIRHSTPQSCNSNSSKYSYIFPIHMPNLTLSPSTPTHPTYRLHIWQPAHTCRLCMWHRAIMQVQSDSTKNKFDFIIGWVCLYLHYWASMSVMVNDAHCEWGAIMNSLMKKLCKLRPGQ